MFENLFDGELGSEIYSLAESAVRDFSMESALSGGVLVGLSGGADSVLLLAFLDKFRRAMGLDFHIAAFHLNHSIRGAEADRDEELSRDVSEKIGVEFISRKIDVPAYAKMSGIGIEEAARNIRYACFEEIIQGRNDLSSVAVAHNASDNIETVIFNMMRGAGLRGLSGIPPTRDRIIRPLIYVPKNKILALLREKNILFATDSTNESTEYTRNYIRHEIVPKLLHLSASPEEMVTRLTQNLRADSDYIDGVAESEFKNIVSNGELPVDALSKLHPAIFSRVMQILAKNAGAPTFEKKQLDAVRELLPSHHFHYSLGSGFEIISECGLLSIKKREQGEAFNFRLNFDENKFEGYSDVFYISKEKLDVFYPNVYKFSIQLRLNFDIMDKAFCIRSKIDGDSYSYGGMTRKLKKLFNDKSVPPTKRSRVPIFTFNGEIVYVPGFSVADKFKGDKVFYINVFEKKDDDGHLKSFFFPK